MRPRRSYGCCPEAGPPPWEVDWYSRRMIRKHREECPEPSDPRLRAGAAAEKQMAFYMQRAFGKDPEVVVLHDLRLVDPEQPRPDGSPDAAQIDHLVLHRWGAFIVESKSCTEAVEVRGDGAGGDEWRRLHDGTWQGFASPIAQGRRQGEFLRKVLQPHNTELKRKKIFGLRQGGFLNMPVQVVVAISDGGNIERRDGWTARTEPFADHVAKADQVTEWIAGEIARHRKAAGLLSREDGQYGIWDIDPADLERVAEFLLARHEPLRPPTPSSPRNRDRAAPSAAAESRNARRRADAPEQRGETVAENRPPASRSSPAAGVTEAAPACRHCGGGELTAKWGKYGYYWSCAACEKNTPMPTVCSGCGAEGRYGKDVRIRKDGPRYERVCEGCGRKDLVWQAE